MSDLFISFETEGNSCSDVSIKLPLFTRQVVALCQAPFLLEDPNVGLIFPADAIARAKHYLSLIPGGLGNFSIFFLMLE